MSSLQEVSQSLDLESPIDLFELYVNDTTPVAYWSNLQNVVFNGQSYPAIATDFEWLAKSSEGAVPTSRLIISDVSGVIGAVAEAFGLVGAKLIVKRTYRLFLDGQPSSDATQFQQVTMRINKRTWEPGGSIELECITGFDIERRKIPNRAYLRRCGWILGDSDCRAPTNISYDLMGNPTSFANRACSKDLKSCKLYHGNDFGRFYGGFLGSSRR